MKLAYMTVLQRNKDAYETFVHNENSRFFFSLCAYMIWICSIDMCLVCFPEISM